MLKAASVIEAAFCFYHLICIPNTRESIFAIDVPYPAHVDDGYDDVINDMPTLLIETLVVLNVTFMTFNEQPVGNGIIAVRVPPTTIPPPASSE